MKQKVERMIVALIPDAVPEVDFTVEILPNGTAAVTKWDNHKLGPFPGLEKLREMYMRYAERRKRIMPNFDNSDPLPYMAEKKDEKARRVFDVSRLPVVDVVNGVAFKKME